MSGAILPGSTIGVLGGGQLGRMFASAARRMGYRVHTLAPEHDTPTGQIADVAIEASYDDLDAIRAFARAVDVVTFEFENVASAAAAAAAECAIVRPSGGALEIAQHRVREKTFLEQQGLAVTPFAAVGSEADLVDAVRRLGRPAVLKTAAMGYDGKGQIKIDAASDDAVLRAAWLSLGRPEGILKDAIVEKGAILEAFIDLEREISVVGARGLSGDVSHFGPIENEHRHHILDVSMAPAGVSPRVAADAVAATVAVMEALDYVGVLCVEFFLARDGRLLINELAPRPHNSGHLTIDACRTSQFEQQLRAICGLPLGSSEMVQPAAAMVNLLGDLWSRREPNWAAALALPDVKLHLYGKREPRAGRKMGHMTTLAATSAGAKARALQARELL